MEWGGTINTHAFYLFTRNTGSTSAFSDQNIPDLGEGGMVREVGEAEGEEGKGTEGRGEVILCAMLLRTAESVFPLPAIAKKSSAQLPAPREGLVQFHQLAPCNKIDIPRLSSLGESIQTGGRGLHLTRHKPIEI